MTNLFSVYKKYPFTIPLRVKVFNVFRFAFTFKPLEKILLLLIENKGNWWKKLVPPIYFYRRNSMRTAVRSQLKMDFDLSSLIDHSIYFYVLNEPSWNNLLSLLKKDFVVFDIGANIGYLTLRFANVCQHGQVVAFEPSAISFSRLQQNVKHNSYDNVRCLNVALGSKVEELPFYHLYENNPGANRILRGNPEKFIEKETVQVSTLDSFTSVNLFARIDVVKIDVEGFELFVLMGGANTITRYRPILFVELSEVNLAQQGIKVPDVLNYISNLNYKITDAKTMQPLDAGLDPIHTDLLCIPIERN